jgi:hypothetical protein
VARGFRRTGRGYRCRLEPEEAALVRRLADEVAALIADGTGGEPAASPGDKDDELERMVAVPSEAPPRPADPILARLFPDAYADDDDAAAEFRRLAQGDLSAGKLAALETLRSSIGERGGDVTLDEEAAGHWLTGLNDLRLTLGTLVGVTDDNTDELAALPRSDPRADLFAIYDFITYLQGTLVEALAGW